MIRVLKIMRLFTGVRAGHSPTVTRHHPRPLCIAAVEGGAEAVVLVCRLFVKVVFSALCIIFACACFNAELEVTPPPACAAGKRSQVSVSLHYPC